MGLIFYPKEVCLPSDHFIHRLLEELPERFSKQKLTKEWIIEGPFLDSSAEEYCFFVINRRTGARESFTVKETDFIFNESAVNNCISRMIACCMEGEMSVSVVQRLMGKSEEEVNTPEKMADDILVVEDFSRGKGRVFRHRKTLDGEEACPEQKKGGLILPGGA